MSERNYRGRQFYRYGQCFNENCEKCKNKETQTVSMRKDFVCESCGKKLHEVKPPRSWKERHGKKVLMAAAGVVIVAGGFTWFTTVNSNNQAYSSTPHQPVIDTISQTDTSKVENIKEKKTLATTQESSQSEMTVSENTVQEQKVSSMPTSKPKQKSTESNKIKLKCGLYEGPVSGGTPSGIGGSITITDSYTLNLKDGNGGEVILEPGDRISNTKFKDGLLQQGQLIRSNGERKFMTGLSELL